MAVQMFITSQDDMNADISCIQQWGKASDDRKSIVYEDVEYHPRKIEIPLRILFFTHYLIANCDCPGNILPIAGCTYTKETVELKYSTATPLSLLYDANDISYRNKEKLAFKLVHDLIPAIQSMNDVGIFHKNIKLENIFISTHGPYVETFIGGFDYATYGKEGDIFEVAFCEQCDPIYCYPQSFDTKVLCKKHDLWSLGICIWEYLCGIRIFDLIKVLCNASDGPLGDNHVSVQNFYNTVKSEEFLEYIYNQLDENYPHLTIIREIFDFLLKGKDMTEKSWTILSEIVSDINLPKISPGISPSIHIRSRRSSIGDHFRPIDMIRSASELSSASMSISRCNSSSMSVLIETPTNAPLPLPSPSPESINTSQFFDTPPQKNPLFKTKPVKTTPNTNQPTITTQNHNTFPKFPG
jgi:serine/threonine protein kinase